MSVEEAGSANAGLASFRAHPADIVLTDYAMPGLTGWDVARALKALDLRVLVDLQMPLRSGVALLPDLRARLPNARLIALTLMEPASVQATALAAGADAFVSKASLEHDLLPAIQGLAPLAHW
jgi:CheY-like chemotaxis protein